MTIARANVDGDTPDSADPHAAFPIVGIGASAGGLAAFEAFFAGMPADADPGMAFVLVQHLAPDHKSILSDLIRRYTRMQVFEVEDGMVVQPNCAYISQRKQDQLELQTALAEQKALLKEVHHRVKNNLQLVTSLLRLEARRVPQAELRTVLTDMQGRVRAMALLHESLYRSGVFATVELAGYVKDLATQAVRVLSGREGVVRLQLSLATLKVTMDQAMPLGLLANELISNAFKHGFAGGRSGDLNITLAALPASGDASGDASALWRLCVSDTGAGLPADFAARRGQSLGLQLAGDLARQAGGRLDVGPGPEAVFRVDFVPAAADAAPASTGHD